MKKHEAVKPLVGKSVPQGGWLLERPVFCFFLLFFLWVSCGFCFVLGEEGEKLL